MLFFMFTKKQRFINICIDISLMDFADLAHLKYKLWTNKSFMNASKKKKKLCLTFYFIIDKA